MVASNALRLAFIRAGVVELSDRCKTTWDEPRPSQSKGIDDPNARMPIRPSLQSPLVSTGDIHPGTWNTTRRPSVDLRNDLVLIFLFLSCLRSVGRVRQRNHRGHERATRLPTPLVASFTVTGYIDQRSVGFMAKFFEHCLLCGTRRDRTSNTRRGSAQALLAGPEFLGLLYVISRRLAISLVHHGEFAS